MIMTNEEWLELKVDEKILFLETKFANRDVEPIKVNESKTLHITHNDLDGVGCVAVGRMLQIYRGEVEYHFISVNAVDDAILTNMVEFDEIGEMYVVGHIIISDVSVKSDEVANFLDGYNTKHIGSINLIDHHGTAQWLNSYDWANVITGGESATYLLADYYWTNGLSCYPNTSLGRPHDIFEYARIVSRYDTWEWKNNPIDYTEKYHSIILDKIGAEGYLSFVINELSRRGNFKIDKNDENIIIASILSENDRIIERDTKRAMNNISKFMFGDFRAGIIKYDGTGSLSVVSNNVIELSNENGDKGIQVLFVLYGDNLLSLRKSASVSTEELDLGMLAQYLAYNPRNGGGHPSAAGCTLSYDAFIELLKIYYKKNNEFHTIQLRMVTPDDNVVKLLGVIKFNDKVGLIDHTMLTNRTVN